VVIKALKSATNDIKQFYTRKKNCQKVSKHQKEAPKPEKARERSDKKLPKGAEMVIKALKSATNDIKQFYTRRKKTVKKCPNIRKKPPSWRKPEREVTKSYQKERKW